MRDNARLSLLLGANGRLMNRRSDTRVPLNDDGTRFNLRVALDWFPQNASLFSHVYI